MGPSEESMFIGNDEDRDKDRDEDGGGSEVGLALGHEKLLLGLRVYLDEQTDQG